MNVEEKSLSAHETAVLVIIMSHRECLNELIDFGGSVSKKTIENEMEKAGFSLFETNMALHRLSLEKGMINEKAEVDDYGSLVRYPTYSLTHNAVMWLSNNEDKLISKLNQISENTKKSDL